MDRSLPFQSRSITTGQGLCDDPGGVGQTRQQLGATCGSSRPVGAVSRSVTGDKPGNKKEKNEGSMARMIHGAQNTHFNRLQYIHDVLMYWVR